MINPYQDLLVVRLRKVEDKMDEVVTRAAEELKRVEDRMEKGEEIETAEESSKTMYHLWVTLDKYCRSFSGEIKAMKSGDYIYNGGKYNFVIRTNNDEILSITSSRTKTMDKRWGILINVDKAEDETKSKLEELAK